MIRIEDIAEQLVPFFKEKGYRKNRLCWYKQSDGITLVFAIQRSQFGSDLWFYCFGVGIDALAESSITSLSKCGITEKIENTINGKPVTSDVIKNAAERWEERYGDMKRLRTAAVEGKLPGMTEKRCLSYLTSVHW